MDVESTFGGATFSSASLTGGATTTTSSLTGTGSFTGSLVGEASFPGSLMGSLTGSFFSTLAGADVLLFFDCIVGLTSFFSNGFSITLSLALGGSAFVIDLVLSAFVTDSSFFCFCEHEVN